jgi:hypothetical protein
MENKITRRNFLGRLVTAGTTITGLGGPLLAQVPFDPYKISTPSLIPKKPPAKPKSAIILFQESEFPADLFFKPRLVLTKRWEQVNREFREKFYVTGVLRSVKEGGTVLRIMIQARNWSDAKFLTAEGMALVLLPKATKPGDTQDATLKFYNGRMQVKGATFPGFKDIVREILGKLAPRGTSELTEAVFRAAGVGKYEAQFDRTLFARSREHKAVGVKWDEMRVDGQWAKPDQIVLSFPLGVSLEEAKAKISSQGLAIAVAVKTTISSQRVFFIIDSLLLSREDRPRAPRKRLIGECRTRIETSDLMPSIYLTTAYVSDFDVTFSWGDGNQKRQTYETQLSPDSRRFWEENTGVEMWSWPEETEHMVMHKYARFDTYTVRVVVTDKRTGVSEMTELKVDLD